MAGEFELIKKYFAPLSGPCGLGLLDDAACISAPPNSDLVITKDLIVEKVHFRTIDPPDMIGWKALAVNVSDCVAKGAKPQNFWLGLALPDGASEEWVAKFSEGLGRAQAAFGCTLAGGDTTKTSGPIVVSVTLMGYVAASRMIKRSGAAPEDDIYVTGHLGSAALGLWCLEHDVGTYPKLVEAYLKPHPPHSAVSILAKYASASADISDGLIADAGHIAAASKVAVQLQRERLPVCKAAQSLLADQPQLDARIWSGGDDYQVVFAANPNHRNDLLAVASEKGVKITRIGRVVAGEGVQLLDPSGQIVQVTSGGYTHF